METALVWLIGVVSVAFLVGVGLWGGVWLVLTATKLLAHPADSAPMPVCPDCDHGVAGGQPCQTCGGSGYADRP
jgi:hypothetical protein